jgi:bifunctional non-homologous end joining protein LigD
MAKAARATGASGPLRVGGVTITHPGRVFWPVDGVTKLDLVRYWEGVADRALPWLAGRPLALRRCPEGLAGTCFFQKHVEASVDPAIGRIGVRDREGKDASYLVVEDAAGLIALAQIGVLEIHLWGSTVYDVERPDLLVFDLDPAEDVGWDRVVEAARQLRDLFAGLGLTRFAKTTGGKGLHVILPVEPALEWDRAKAFTRAVSEAFVAVDPGRFTASMAKRFRPGRIFVDYLRNAGGNTAIAPFSTWARPGAPVAMPVAWDELDRVRPDGFDLRNAPRHLASRRRDPWAGFARQDLGAALARLAQGAAR